MPQHLRTGLVLAALCAAAPLAALADSDGYYCIGEDYLAYEFGPGRRHVNSNEVHDGDHTLTILRASKTQTGIVDVEEIALQPFQTHGMACDAGAVRIFAFTKGVRIDLSDNTLTEFPVDRDARNRHAAPTLAAQPGVEMKTRADVFPLSNWSDQYRYELHITRHTQSDGAGGPGNRHYTLSRIVRISPGYDHAGSYVIFDGFHAETID